MALNVSSLLGDLRIGARVLWRQRGLSAAVILPVALAVAATTSLFSIVDGLLYRPLPFRDGDQLVTMAWHRVDGAPPPVAYQPQFERERVELAARVRNSPLLAGVALDGLTDWLIADPHDLRGFGLQVSGASIGFFHTVGIPVALGREFTKADQDVVAAAHMGTDDLVVPVILGDDVWRRLFAGRADILDRAVDLAGRHVRVVGIIAPRLHFPGHTNVWTPLPGSFTSRIPPPFGRLAEGATLDQLRGTFPEFGVAALRDAVRPGGAEALTFLLVAAGLFLLVSWVQVAALVFAGAVGRLPEIGVRLAIGASRARLVRQFVAEGALLTFGALILAWTITPLLTAFIVGVLPESLSRGQYVSADARAFLFASITSLVGLGLLCTLPIELVRRADPLALLRQTLGRTRLSAARLRHGLVVMQVALTAALLYVSGLAVHSFVRVTTLDYGFDADKVLVFRPLNALVSRDPVAEYERLQQRIRDSAAALRATPGVIAATPLDAVPFLGQVTLSTSRFGGGVQTTDAIVEISGRPVPPIALRPREVGRDFVSALGATVIAGRPLSDPEYAGVTNVALINESLAQRLSPLLPVVGMSIRTRWFNGRVVGVIKDLIDVSPGAPPDLQLFYPARKWAGAVILIRTAGPAATAQPLVTRVLERTWGRLPPSRVEPLANDLHELLAPWRGRSVLLSLIAGLCLPLAAIGLGGALMYSVRSRTREIAIRQVLGADRVDVRRQVVLSALRLMAVGLAIGVSVGIAMGRVMASQFHPVSFVDGWTVVAVCAGLLSLAWFAALIPADRATRIQPSAALREG